MKYLLLTLLIFSTKMALSAPVLSEAAEYEINRSSSINRKYAVGTALAKTWVKGKWSFAKQGGAVTTYELLDAEGRVVILPGGAIVTNCVIDVVTQPVSANNTATMTFGIVTALDLKASTTLGSYNTNARIACTPTGTIATMIKLVSERSMKVDIGVQAVTAGDINVFLQYVLSN